MSPAERFGFGVALALGVLVRFLPVLGAAAPVGDGGLFLSMIEDIRGEGLGLPEATTYNDLGIPLLYPPLALLAAAALGELGDWATIEILRWMPPIVSVLGLGAFSLLAWRLLPPFAALAAALAYALMPHAYDWVIAGGGLTRGAGLLFALLALALVADRSRWSSSTAVAAGALLGLAALSHPQAPIFGVIACVILTWQRPVGAWLRLLSIAAASAAVVVLPWLIWVLATHGIEAFTSVGHRLEPLTGLIRMSNLRFSGAPFMDVFGVLGVVGAIASILRRQWRLPMLLVGTYLAGSGGGEFMGLVVWALLAGRGGHELVDLAVRARPDAGRRSIRVAGVALGGVTLFLALIGSVGSFTDKSSKLHVLSAGHVSAMRWLSQNSDEHASVIAPTNEWWGDDELSEWLPALTQRRSYGTVQGSEWLGLERFNAQQERHIAILSCARSTAECYRSIDDTALIFVPKGSLAGPFSPADCCPALRATLEDAGYEVIYDGPGATIARPAG